MFTYRAHKRDRWKLRALSASTPSLNRALYKKFPCWRRQNQSLLYFTHLNVMPAKNGVDGVSCFDDSCRFCCVIPVLSCQSSFWWVWSVLSRLIESRVRCLIAWFLNFPLKPNFVVMKLIPCSIFRHSTAIPIAPELNWSRSVLNTAALT